ncbi:VirB4 family type IV secretion system protein [Listeria booriae]|uniref:VirB4 family type IV secretion system protein n=1 Tax=Listeria booriae TaxID=1552123 RepID=UPI001625A055|nr:DUF87 domain-containing protein [Listeria booriae]MBC1228616.1 DUF87 domain-containing protein [Listeria booriae]
MFLKTKKHQTSTASVVKQNFSNIENLLDSSSLEDVYGFSWDEKLDYIISGDNYIRIVTVVDYPKNKKYGNWMSELKRKKGNITIVQYMESSNSEIMLEHYNNTIKNKQAELLKVYDPRKTKELENKIKAAEYQLDQYMSNSTTYIYQYTYIYLQAKTLEELNNLSDNINSTLIKLQLKSMIPTKATYQTFWSSLPIVENLLGEYTYKESNTDAASSMFPFDDAEILNLNPRSDIEGINRDTKSLIAVDYEDRNNVLNQNMVVIGTSGVGKTTYMIQKILRYVARGIKVFILDPENEYSEIVEFLGGTVMHLSSNAKTKINPLQLFSDDVSEDIVDNDMETLIKDKIQRVKSFFEVLKPDISQVEKSLLDSVLRNTYINAGILKHSTIKDIPAEHYPILTNVYEEIEKLEETAPDRYEILRDFYYILESYVKGSNTIFNGHTNVKLDSKLVSFNLKALQNEPDTQAAAYLNTFSFIWDEITKNKDEIIKLFADEFHFMVQNQGAANFFYQAYKRFRKYKAAAIAGTQQIQDVIEGRMKDGRNVGEAIIGNSYTKVFFGLDNKGVDDVVNKLQLKFSEKEMKLLRSRKQGQALMIHGSKRAFMKIELTEEELRLKDPVKYEEIYGVSAEIIPDYEARIAMTPAELEEVRQFSFTA